MKCIFIVIIVLAFILGVYFISTDPIDKLIDNN